jgi:carboxylesterase
MPLAPHAEPFLAEGAPGVDGTRVGVLLVHGLTGSPASLVPWARHLAGEGFAVSVPRLPGHGTTWQELNRTVWRNWYDECDRSLARLSATCDRVVVGGLSVGGCLALRLAQEHGDALAGVMLVNPFVASNRRELFLLPLLKWVLPWSRGVVNDIKKPGQDEHGYDRLPLRALASTVDMWRTVQPALPQVTQPVVYFRSAEDHVIDLASSEMVLARISSRDVEEHILENSYHVATLDNDAPLILEESVKFVRRVTGP